MSMKKYWTKVPNGVTHDAKVPLALRGFYALLRSFGDWDTGKNCHPGEALLAERAGCDVRTVARYVKALERAGLVVVTRKRGRVNLYSFTHTTDTRVSTSPQTPVSGGTDNLAPKPPTPVSSYRDVTKNYYPKFKKLFHGNDECTVSADGTIEIYLKHNRSRVHYSQGDDEPFRYGNLSGTEARRAAAEDAKRRAANN